MQSREIVIKPPLLKIKFALTCILLNLFCACDVREKATESDLKLWYDRPAEYFEESLVLGNGKMGASVFGGVKRDKIYLNDITLWSGEPVDAHMNPEAYKNVAGIRKALENDDFKKADALNKSLQGSFSQSYAPLGTMYINFDHDATATSYYRELNIGNATSKVEYAVNGATYTREYFISHPDQVMVIKLTSDKKGELNFNIGFESLLQYDLSASADLLEVHGYAPYHAEPSYRGDMPNAVMFDEERGTRFTSLLKINNSDGRLSVTDTTVNLTGATEAVVYVSIATSFNGFDKDPAREGLDNQQIARSSLAQASTKNYEALKKSHTEDYQEYFNRVSLEFDAPNTPVLPTDRRLKRYSAGEKDKGLEILYFQFGRYLLISSSRTMGVPANLQGIWNPYIRPPWSSNYTANINVQENYWLAESGNLSEMHRPLLSFIENLAETGKITARTFYGVGGWAACHNSDIWAMSNPVGDFGKGNPQWANWNMGGTWLSTHLWEHYEYTRDETFLKDKYPVIKGAAQFCLEWLVEDKHGHLITSPSTSPENRYVTPDGYKGATLYGATADLAMIRESFEQTIRASEILDVDADFREKLKAALDRLYPYQVGKKGNLQEWYHDWEDADPKHRHQTHLFGLHPGSHISPEKTPALAAASKVSLEIKGDETTGWSKGWRINLWARLLDGDRAYKMYRELLSFVEPDGMRATYDKGGGTYPNLLDAHPPFQIDGNFGGAAGMIEMLMQSHLGRIDILPALPTDLPAGSVKGLKARGGFEVAFSWKDGALTALEILSLDGQVCKINYKGKSVEFPTQVNELYSLNSELE